MSQSRLIDLLKNIQTYEPLDEGAQGRMWFEIRYLLKKKVLTDQHLYDDGRTVRNYLLSQIHSQKEELFVVNSPRVVLLSRLRDKARKFEPIISPSLKLRLTLSRQTSS